MSKLNFLLLSLVALACSCQSKDKSMVPVSVADEVLPDSLRLTYDSISVDKEDAYTCISEDGALKFYCWNTGMGGTSPDFAVYCQYRTMDGKVKTQDLSTKEIMPAWVDAVHSIKKDDGSTFYIVKRSHRASSNDGYVWMDAFVIDHDSLRNVSVIDAGDNLNESGYEFFEVNYCISDWYYKAHDEGWDWLFYYDAESRNLYVPLTVKVEEPFPFVSDRYRAFHFDGSRFADMGESPHMGLHESLSQYYRLACFYRTKNYIVRVDWLDDQDSLRYASWKLPKDMSQQPDLTVMGGKYNVEDDAYTFVNDGYEYVMGYTENKPMPGGITEYHEYLLVRKDGRAVLKEERVSP